VHFVVGSPPPRIGFDSLSGHMEKKDLLGAVILCPHCTQPRQIVEVGAPIRDGASTGFVVYLDDGGSARFWLTGPKSKDDEEKEG